MKEKLPFWQSLGQAGWGIISLFAGIAFFHSVGILVRDMATAKAASLPVIGGLSHRTLMLIAAIGIPLLSSILHAVYVRWVKLLGVLIVLLCLIAVFAGVGALVNGLILGEIAPVLVVMSAALLIIILRFLARNDGSLLVKLLILALALAGGTLAWCGRQDLAGINWNFSGMLLVVLFSLLSLLSRRKGN